MKSLTVDMPLAVPHQRPPSKYASHPYPFLIDEDAYSPTVKSLDFTLKAVLTQFFFDSYYHPLAKPLDFTLKPILIDVNIEGDGYKPLVKPMDFVLKDILNIISVGGCSYQPKTRPLDFLLEMIVVRYYHPNEDKYKPSVKPLDFTLS